MFSKRALGKTWGKVMANLTAAKVRAITTPGLHGDGRGLYLRVAAGGSKAWIQRIAIEGRGRDMGPGGFPAVSLARARQLADANRAAIAEGRNPPAEKRRARTRAFREASVAARAANLYLPDAKDYPPPRLRLRDGGGSPMRMWPGMPRRMNRSVSTSTMPVEESLSRTRISSFSRVNYQRAESPSPMACSGPASSLAASRLVASSRSANAAGPP